MTKKQIYLKYAILAAGFLISAAFYVHSEAADEIVLKKGLLYEESLLEEGDVRAKEKMPGESQTAERDGTAAGETGNAEMEMQLSDALKAEIDAYAKSCVERYARALLAEEANAEAAAGTASKGADGEAADVPSGAESAQHTEKASEKENAVNAGGAAGSERGECAAGKLVNLNTAAKEELMQLKGIGEAKAEAIIRYREEIGAFLYVEELMNISGIKEAAFEKLRDQVCVR